MCFKHRGSKPRGAINSKPRVHGSVNREVLNSKAFETPGQVLSPTRSILQIGHNSHLGIAGNSNQWVAKLLIGEALVMYG